MYTSDKLIASIKRRGFVPPTQKTFSNADILALCDEEVQTRIAPYLVKGREEFLVFSQDVPVVAGDNRYRIPARALGGKLRDVEYVNAQGDVVRIPRLEPDSESVNAPGYSGSGYPRAFYMEANSVVLLPVPAITQGALRLSYYMRPNSLILPSQGATVVEINGSVLTVNGPQGWNNETTRYDVLKGTPGFEAVAVDQIATAFTAVGSGVYEFSFGSDLTISEVELGDYICPAGTSVIPMLPADLHPLLAQRIAVKILEALGDKANIEVSRRQLQEMEASLLGLINNRVEGVRRSAVPAIRRWI